jgi:hypothetical protein
MRIGFFHLMPYRFLPDDFQDRYRSVWVDVPCSLFEAGKAHELYNEYLDELEHAERCGFDGLCVNEHHAASRGSAGRRPRHRRLLLVTGPRENPCRHIDSPIAPQ